MNDRYQKTFNQLKKEKRIGFCPFAVLGHPNKKESLVRIKKYLAAKPDFLELGIPFSDPVADGPTIEEADRLALKNGMTPPLAIQMIKNIRSLDDEIPIGILTYANIVLQYGIDAFYRELKKAGADSILIADVPLEEVAPYGKAAKKHAIHQIFLVSEYTDSLRLKKILQYGSGFLYVVSALGTTGTRMDLGKGAGNVIKKIRPLTNLPLMVGFGISTKKHLNELQKMGADGGIVGSALVKLKTSELSPALRNITGRYLGKNSSK